MKKSFGSYRRLARGLLGMSSIWMGEDHLVVIKGSGFLLPFTEHYRRFRYEDIQYLAVTKTSRMGGLMGCLSGFLIFAGIAAATANFQNGGEFGAGALVGLAVCASLAAFFVFLFLRHLFLGPLCVCDLKTSLRRERMVPLNRLHQAQQAVELLAKLISEKQASLAPGFPRKGSERTLTVEEIRRAEAQQLSVSRLVPAAAGACGLFSIGLASQSHFSSRPLPALTVLLFLVAVFLVVAAISASVQKASPDSIRRGLFWLLGLMVSTSGIGAVYLLQKAATDPSLMVGLGPLDAFRDIRTYGGSVYSSLFMGAAIMFFLVSTILFGLAIVWRRRLGDPP